MKRTLIILVVGLMVLGCQINFPNAIRLAEEQKVWKDMVIGEYRHPYPPLSFISVKEVFLENGVYEHYINGKKQVEKKTWEIVDRELHLKGDSDTMVYFVHRNPKTRRNPNGQIIITLIASIKDGKRTDRPLKNQMYWIKRGGGKF